MDDFRVLRSFSIETVSIYLYVTITMTLAVCLFYKKRQFE